MFNVGSGEFLVIFLLALIVLGPDKLPETARKVGKVLGDLRTMSSGFQAEMREAMDVDGIKQALNPTTMMNSPSAAADPTPATTAPDVAEPTPAPMPTEIRAAAPPADTDDVPAPRASTPTPPPAKGQQGAA
jgi:sec-independent protein translocase protein TatB